MTRQKSFYPRLSWGVSGAVALGILVWVFLFAGVDGDNWGSAIYHFLLPVTIREKIFPYRVALQRESLVVWRDLFSQWFSQPYLYLFIAITLFLEIWMPTVKRRLVSVGMLQDIVWFIATALLSVTLLAACNGMLSMFYDEYLTFLTLDAARTWPLGLRVLLSVLTLDLFLWAGHFIRHRTQFFWCFHLVHHSQREVNFFTENRAHLVDHIMASAVRFVPMRMVGVEFTSIVAVHVILSWYTYLYHGNIRSNFGLLKYVLVTPQSHRIHHSIEERHWGKNLGTYFTIWDRMFGTFIREI
jgi:sterol desaturase/sphingolipid hydroxylase (fatty acid hydroxylase superfamily)